ncbi:MAG TPA: phBC6A51 family helix-turn-helix protein [Actinomycetes bacterium]|nr:phBC6A51 family helix-turn-helix protein [Actinomycetes bacterium]
MPRRNVPVLQDAKKMRYIEWLNTPRQFRIPPTKAEMAAALDVYPKTLYNWENDREFRKVWRGEADEILDEHGAEDKVQVVLDSLYQAARDPRSPRHVTAAKLYLETIGAIGPQRVEVQVSSKALSMLSDDEIERLIARGLAEQRAEVEAGDEP